MKKTWILFCAAALAAASAILPVSAAAENENYDIPKAAAAPVIDGVMGEREWDNALVRELNADNANSPTNMGFPCPDASFYYMWDEDGIYLFADVTDGTAPQKRLTQGSGAYNTMDGVQLNIFPDTTGSAKYFWSLVITEDGTPACGEHFVFGGGKGADVPEVEIAGKLNGSSYTIEAFFPVEVWEAVTPAIEIQPGSSFIMGNIVMENNGTNGSTDLFTDTAWSKPASMNTYTLVNTTAGAAETTAAVTTAAPATEAATSPAQPTASAPATFDIAVIAAAAAAASAAGIVLGKKKH